MPLTTPGAKTIKKNTNSTQNKSQTHHAKQYEVTSFLSTDCELSTETCPKNVYSLGPRCDSRARVVLAISQLSKNYRPTLYNEISQVDELYNGRISLAHVIKCHCDVYDWNVPKGDYTYYGSSFLSRYFIIHLTLISVSCWRTIYPQLPPRHVYMQYRPGPSRGLCQLYPATESVQAVYYAVFA